MRSFLSRIIRGTPEGTEPYVQLLVAYSEENLTDKQHLAAAIRGFPLTWWNVWTCALLSAVLGILTGLSEPSRFSSHIFDGAKATLDWAPGQPMAAWGWCFLAAGTWLMVTTQLHPMAVVVTLRAIGPVYVFHAVLIGMGASHSLDASWSGVPFCLFVCMVHLEAAQSIRMIMHFRFPKGRP